MDKNTFENYGFLSATNDPGSQFFLVQEDGTFLLNKTEGQFVTEEGISDQCTIYDVTQSQFLVDNNASTSLVTTVPETFIVPSSASTSDVYGTNDTEEANNVPDSIPVEDIDLQDSNCTEITLSTEQYNLLQQNGWSLLETGDKVLMLDSSGLQDITNNLDLIQQLKAEIQSKTEQVAQTEKEQKVKSSRSILKSNVTSNDISTEPSQESLQTPEDTIELVFDDSPAQVKVSDVSDLPMVNNDKAPKMKLGNAELLRHLSGNEPVKNTQPQNHNQNHPPKPQLSSPLKLKTQYYWKDIPTKIYLGKTVNGKNLVARVKSIINNQHKRPTLINEVISKKDKINKQKRNKPVECSTKQVVWRNASHLKNVKIGRSDEGAEKMFDEAVSTTEGNVATTPETAAAVAVQLMQTPSLLPMIADAHLIITKLVKSGERGKHLETCVLTGRMSISGECPQFIHLPTLLQDIVHKSKNSHKENGASVDEDDFSVLHVHISETQYTDQEDAISITLNKRSLEPPAEKLSLYECASCPVICKTAQELEQHQEIHDMDAEDKLTIDTGNVSSEAEDDIDSKKIKQLNTRHGKLYQCVQCTLQFTRLSNCKKHLDTHRSFQIVFKTEEMV